MTRTVYLMVGNIGTGKTTLAKSLINQHTLYISDDLLAPLMTNGRYDADVWTQAHFRVYRQLKLCALEAAIRNNFDCIIDGTNISIANRAKYIELAKKVGCYVICYDCVKFHKSLNCRDELMFTKK